MAERIKVGIVDSGFSAQMVGAERVIDAQGFTLEDGALQQVTAIDDQLGHGSSILEVINSQAPEAEIAVAQVFRERLTTTALQVAAAIEWLVEQQVDLINLSLGLRNDREPLRLACEAAIDCGIVVCASTPARGDPVYPAAYPGVFRMTGDARCEPDQISCLKTRYADFGGYVKARNGVVGASAGCAHLTGHIARYLSEGGDPASELIDRWLEQQAIFFGAEVRFPERQMEPGQ